MPVGSEPVAVVWPVVTFGARTVTYAQEKVGGELVSTETNQVTVETLERLLDAFNAHDIDAVMSFFADDCVQIGRAHV